MSSFKKDRIDFRRHPVRQNLPELLHWAHAPVTAYNSLRVVPDWIRRPAALAGLCFKSGFSFLDIRVLCAGR